MQIQGQKLQKDLESQKNFSRQMQIDPHFVLEELEFFLVYLVKSKAITGNAKAVYRNIFLHFHKLVQRRMYATSQSVNNCGIYNR